MFYCHFCQKRPKKVPKSPKSRPSRIKAQVPADNRDIAQIEGYKKLYAIFSVYPLKSTSKVKNMGL